MSARIWNIIAALCCICSGVRIAPDWYVGDTADWFVWSAAIYACVVVTLWSVRDAIRGER